MGTDKKKRTKTKAKGSKSIPKIKKKRDQTKNPGLDKRLFSKIKQEYHDIDYIDSLSAEEKDWLSRFMEEHLGANDKHKGKKIYKRLDTKAGRKKIYDPNNQRNRDVYARAKAAGMTLDLDPKFVVEALQAENDWADTTEDKLIEMIDSKKSNEFGE